VGCSAGRQNNLDRAISLLDAILGPPHATPCHSSDHDTDGIHLFYVILLPVDFEDTPEFTEKAAQFIKGTRYKKDGIEHSIEHGILVRKSVALGPLLDAPEVVACFYGAGYRATVEVARAAKIAVPRYYHLVGSECLPDATDLD
jgi:hypothetical protein